MQSIDPLNGATVTGVTADARRSALRVLLQEGRLLRFIESHNPISALIAQAASATVSGRNVSFDGFWSSSLTDSTELGKPDIEAVDISRRLANIDQIFEVTTRPLIMDADTGGRAEHFALNVRTMDRLGISAVIIEDKNGLKRNSLLGTTVAQSQEDIGVFCEKIRLGRSRRLSEDFMVIARIESLILGQGMDAALSRAHAYIDAGADGIMIHSSSRLPDEVFEFARQFRRSFVDVPLVCVPTSYNGVTETDLADHSFNIVIYANHMMRAAYPAMHHVARAILQNGRTLEVDDRLLPMEDIVRLIPPVGP